MLKKTILIFTTITLMAAMSARAQSIASFHVPSEVCAGSNTVVTFGKRATNNVVVATSQATLGHSERIFLPDGVECNGSCSYRSPVTFADFDPSSRISSVQDIKYVRLNMEHSFIGDIYINITCPNGQKADIMRFGGSGTSSCDGTIPSSSTGWLSGSNIGEDNFFGDAYDLDNSSQKCNPNASGNEPGVGWNYCWSNNTTSGYQYASGDGIVYRSGHAHNGRVDSSNVALHRNFYHPDQSFASLIGCPLNGTWFIEVVDGYSIDNGYIFEWDLSLDPSLIPDLCDVASYSVAGGPYTRINDSTFRLNIPSVVLNDTVLHYTFRVYSTCGGYVDTSASIIVHPNYHGLIDTTVCDHLRWGSSTFTHDTSFTFSGTTVHGCDSNGTLRLTVNHGYNVTHRAEVVENDLPYSYRGLTFSEAVADSLLHFTTRDGCDSNVSFTLVVHRNQHVQHDTAVCSNHLPVEWRGHTFDGPDTLVLTQPDRFGADSIVTLLLVVNPAYDTSFADETCDNVPYYVGPQLIGEPGLHTVGLATVAHCDSTVHVDLTIHPHYELHTYDSTCAHEPYHFEGATYLHTGTYPHRLLTAHRCDSVLTLHLTVLAEELRAEIKAIPLLVTTDAPDIRLYNVSTAEKRHLWQIQQNESQAQQLVYTYPAELDSLPITLIAYSGEGCADTATVVAHIDRTKIVTPNVFTPNLETNNMWYVGCRDVAEMELWIYSRQGHLVAHLDEVGQGWDGTSLDGTPCPQGSYVYTLRYRSVTRPEWVLTQSGSILLIR